MRNARKALETIDHRDSILVLKARASICKFDYGQPQIPDIVEKLSYPLSMLQAQLEIYTRSYEVPS